MRLKYSTREGHFNWSNTSEVSLSCNVAVYDDSGERIKVCNFTPEYEMDGTDVEDIVTEIEASMKRYWSTSNDRKDMIEFLQEHETEIDRGNAQYRLEEIDKQLEKLNSEKKSLLAFVDEVQQV